MRNKFLYCPDCGKGHRFAVNACEKCGYGKLSPQTASDEVEAAAAELIAEDQKFTDAPIPADLFE